MKETSRWLCLRTSVEKILEVSRRLFSQDVKTAHEIGMKAAELLRDGYLKNPPALCGRKTSALIAGAMYVACLLEDEWKAQWEVAEACEITETSVRNSYRLLIKVLELEDKLLVRRLYGWGFSATEAYYPKIPGMRRAKEASPSG